MVHTITPIPPILITHLAAAFFVYIEFNKRDRQHVHHVDSAPLRDAAS
jgi:hypothetical protein